MEENVDDAMEINSKPAGNSDEALAMRDKLQLFLLVVLLIKQRCENENQMKKTKIYQHFFNGLM